MKTTQITKEVSGAICDEINIALTVVADHYNLQSLLCRPARYTDGVCNFNVQGIAKGALNPEAQSYADKQTELGLPDIGSSFVAGGATWVTVGLNSSGNKVVCEGKEDKRTSFHTDIVVALCKKAA